MNDVIFIDTETTGLDPYKHEIWDLALIKEDGTEYQWFVKPNLRDADPVALEIGRYYNRTSQHSQIWKFNNGYEGKWSSWGEVLETVRELTWNKHLCGAVPSFDEERLRRLMQEHGIPFKWHYHLIDIEALAVGYLKACRSGDAESVENVLPWKSRELYKALGVESDPTTEHTALGDARLAKAVYERIMK
jgi:DNA polymerase III epsilon subunit-like protein